jgi:hypothetical protein
MAVFGLISKLLSLSQILFSADDEMDDSEEEDVRRLTGLKTVKKKKKHRMGITV